MRIEYAVQNTYPLRLRLDLDLFLAVIKMLLGVNGFMFATGFSDLFW